jgi:hypothetical protein
MTETYQTEFEAMTPEQHGELKTKLTGLYEKPKEGTLERYAYDRYYHCDVYDLQVYKNALKIREWAHDPLCYEQERCLQEFERRKQRRQNLEEDPFDPRTEVSADAKKIVAHMWIILVLLPFVLGLLYAILRSL